MGKVSKELLEKIYTESFKYNYNYQFYQLKKVEEKNLKLNEKISSLEKEIEKLTIK